MIRKELIFLVWSDLDRLHTDPDFKKFLREMMIGQSFRYIFWYRVNQYFDSIRSRWMLPFRLMARLILHHYGYKFGIGIGLRAEIGPGFKIEHYGTIFVNPRARIGLRCTLAQGVTIGEYNGCPRLRDFIFVGPGAKIIGPVRVGNNAIIGANCVVTKDVPDNAVTAGIPGKIISLRGNLRGTRLEEAMQLRARYRSRCPRQYWPKYRLNEEPGGHCSIDSASATACPSN
jgi:serine O-acetyltransferase